MARNQLIIKHLAGFPAAVAALALFACLAGSSISEKGVSADEIAHLTAGYSYWETGDYRLNPENGLFPQLWAAFPVYLDGYRFPPTTNTGWKVGSYGHVGNQFFYGLGNDLDTMLRGGRLMVIVLGVGLGVLIYAWSRALFGRVGGMVSLLLYVLSPNFLAHTRLVTSDVAFCFTFTLSVLFLWRLMHRVSAVNLMLGAVSLSLLFLSKVSALLILPLVAVLILVRLIGRAPLTVTFGGMRRVGDRAVICGVVTAMLLVLSAVVWLAVWAAYGFHFRSSATGPSMRFAWDTVLSTPTLLSSIVELLLLGKFLPESYLFGVAHVSYFASERAAYLNGQYSSTGWWYFFPYAALIKTPLSTLVMLLAAMGSGCVAWICWPTGGRGRRSRRALYRVVPLLVIVVVYGTFALTSKLNIGHRHVLPIYPAVFVLAGGTGFWLVSRYWLVRIPVMALLVSLAVETFTIHPHYLAYFNQLAGGPRDGYRHLVDSSLDWGQDLPGLKRWLDRDAQLGPPGPVYLAYFGADLPARYGIKAHRLPGHGNDGYAPSSRFSLGAGTYCVSATVLANHLNRNADARGPWTPRHENFYQNSIRSQAEQFEQSLKQPNLAEQLIEECGREYWSSIFMTYDTLRTARLFAYLREREPDHQIGHAILIYRLDDTDLHDALVAPRFDDSAPIGAPSDQPNRRESNG